MVTVHLCPGHNAVAAQFLYGLLATHPDLEISRCEACLGARTNARVIVMVTGLASTDELAEVARVRREHPEAALIVLSLCDSRLFHEAILAHGADRYVPLDDAMPGLVDAILECATARAGASPVMG